MITRYFGANYIFFFYCFWNDCLPQGSLCMLQLHEGQIMKDKLSH